MTATESAARSAERLGAEAAAAAGAAGAGEGAWAGAVAVVVVATARWGNSPIGKRNHFSFYNYLTFLSRNAIDPALFFPRTTIAISQHVSPCLQQE